MPVFVNKHEITDDQVHAEMEHHPAPDLDTARLEAARALVVRHLLLEDAVRREITTSDAVQDMSDEEAEDVIKQLLDSIITTPDPDDETCARFYDQHQQNFVDKKTEKVLPYELVKPHIVQYLEDKAYHAAFHAYLDTLMSEAEIVGLAA